MTDTDPTPTTATEHRAPPVADRPTDTAEPARSAERDAQDDARATSASSMATRKR